MPHPRPHHQSIDNSDHPAGNRATTGSMAPGGWFSLAVCVSICFLAAAVGSVLTTPALEPWYAGLKKPSWNPPNAVFGPVWSLLYLLMAVAVWRIWRLRQRPGAPAALVIFGVQLALNVAWSGLFFGLQQPGWAAVEIVLLLLAIGLTMACFRRLDQMATWLLVPYLAWVGFATVLNWTLWRMNA